MKQFHAHVYFQENEIEQIKVFQTEALQSPLKFWKLFENRVGPHSLPMLELRFNGANEERAVEWLTQNRGIFSVLIHEDTGDDVKDHEKARWLGKVLPIHYEFFETVKNDPKLAIHSRK